MAVEIFDLTEFHTGKVSGIIDIGTVNQQIITFSTPSLDPGLYLIGYAFEAAFNEQKNQPLIYSLTGTYAGAEFSLSIGDNDIGEVNNFYSFPKQWAGGVITIGLQARKSASFAQQLDITFADVFVKRIG